MRDLRDPPINLSDPPAPVKREIKEESWDEPPSYFIATSQLQPFQATSSAEKYPEIAKYNCVAPKTTPVPVPRNNYSSPTGLMVMHNDGVPSGPPSYPVYVFVLLFFTIFRILNYPVPDVNLLCLRLLRY